MDKSLKHLLIDLKSNLEDITSTNDYLWDEYTKKPTQSLNSKSLNFYDNNRRTSRLSKESLEIIVDLLEKCNEGSIFIGKNFYELEESNTSYGEGYTEKFSRFSNYKYSKH